MEQQRQAIPGRPLGWFVATGLVMIACLVALARLDRTGDTGGRATGVAGGSNLEQVRPDWWETRRAVYNEIPTRVLFRLPGGGRARAEALAGLVWSEFERIRRVFSPFDPTSEVGRLNRAAAGGGRREVPLSPDLYRVLDCSRRLFEASRGGFDPTIWPIRKLWHEAVLSQRQPAEAEIALALKRVGLGRLGISAGGDGGPRLTLPEEGAELDFGAIAKGYAVDRVEALLHREGVPSALVALGGEICAFGDNDGEPWKIGIQHPRKDQAVWGVIAVQGGLRVSTSGNYRQPLRIAGKTYYHIFDPRTGRPASSETEGVTTMVAGDRESGALLDGAATAVAVLGPAAGLELARRLGIEALILVSGEDGGVREVMTEGFRACYRRGPATGGPATAGPEAEPASK